MVEGANPCTCSEQGPLVIETNLSSRSRVACCYCWRVTSYFNIEADAVAAWNAGKVLNAETQSN